MTSVPVQTTSITTVTGGVEDPGAHPYRHEIRLSGLSQGSTYFYRVTQGAHERAARFETAPGLHGPEQRIPLLEALRTFTANGAFLTFDEDVRGTLQPGHLADLVILEGDLLSAAPDDLLTMSERVLLTMAGGRTVYRRSDFPF